MFGFGKGKIDIQLSNYNYSPGDIIEGTVTLNLNKPFKARGVKIKFIGERKTSSFSPRNSSITFGGVRNPGANYSNQIVFDFTQPLDGAKEYSGESSYKFQIKIPKNLPTQPGGEGVGGAVIKTLQALSSQSSRTDWYLKAFLDIPMGIDVSKKVQINIA